MQSGDKENFFWKEGLRVLRDWKIWALAVSALLYGVGMASSSNFLPVSMMHMNLVYTLV